MLYMVEMDFRNPAREADWHVWYLQHMAKLIRTVPGFRASQRFRAITSTPSPWLAMHDVASAAVFQSPQYRASGGPAATGEWQAEHTNWYRNLFDGIDHTPEVAPDAHLLVSEGDARARLGQVSEPVAASLMRLVSIGLDQSSSSRGIAIIPAGRLTAGLFDLPGVRIFKPISPRITG
jgi:hypothetical protein